MKRISNWNSIPFPERQIYSPRWGHSACVYNDSVYFFGGYSSSYMDDIYEMNLKTKNFTKLEPETDDKEINFSYSLFSTVFFESKIIFYGGMTFVESKKLFDPFYYDIKTNKMNVLKTVNPPLKRRVSHTGSLLQGRYMLIFGGEECESSNAQTALDSYVLDLQDLKWKKIVNQEMKVERKFHCSCVVNLNTVYIFGGYHGNYECINDMLIIDFSSCEWTGHKIYVQCRTINFNQYRDIYPFPRWGASMNLYNDSLVIFGGRNKCDFCDLWQFNLKTEKFTKIESYTESPSPRRKHVAFTYKGNYFVSGGYNGKFINDFHFVNLKFLRQFQEKDEDIKKYINNKNYCDMYLETQYGKIPCHKTFFLSRIAEEDMILSENIFKLSNKYHNNIIDISTIKIPFESIITFISLLYLGYFPYYISAKDLSDVISIMQHLNLNKTIKVLFSQLIISNIFTDFSSFTSSDILRLINKTLQRDKLINSSNFNEIKPILKRNNFKLLKKFHILFSNIIYFKFAKTNDAIPERIKYLFDFYIDSNYLPIVKTAVDDMCVFIEGLFYSDYFCYSSLYNKIELVLINIIRTSNLFSRRFLVFIFICAYYTNSEILSLFILQKLREEFKVKSKKIVSWVKKELGDERYKSEIANFIITNSNYNREYYSLCSWKNHVDECISLSVMNFADVFKKNSFKEKKAVVNLLNVLNNAQIHFNVPSINIKCNKVV